MKCMLLKVSITEDGSERGHKGVGDTCGQSGGEGQTALCHIHSQTETFDTLVHCQRQEQLPHARRRILQVSVRETAKDGKS